MKCNKCGKEIDEYKPYYELNILSGRVKKRKYYIPTYGDKDFTDSFLPITIPTTCKPNYEKSIILNFCSAKCRKKKLSNVIKAMEE